MCLVVDFRYHSDRKPKVADRPFIVKKRLRKDRLADKYITPYQYTEVIFGMLYDNFRDFEEEIDRVIRGVDRTIDYGHHSFRYGTTIQDFIDRRYTIADRNTVWVYGVIPAGTRFYVGLYDDLVSEQIVYYQTLNDIKKAYGCKNLGKPRRLELDIDYS